jgi:ubiquinone/menaquinone biosynthesis C-methylase UbiE
MHAVSADCERENRKSALREVEGTVRGIAQLKDLFSDQAELYAKHRPVYPRQLYDFILSFVQRRDAALDCATGNGQVARALAPSFRIVQAIDISESQVHHALRLHNIEYSVSRAEQTAFQDNSFDLIAVAQAYHWFDGTQFCREATRVARSGGIVAIWGYDLAHSNSEIDSIVHHWNFDVLAPYWEPERKHVYTHYENLPFDFESIPAPEFTIELDWTSEDLIGHLQTWSALQTMMRRVGDEAFRTIVGQIQQAWGDDGKKRFVLPVFLKLGRVPK